MTRIDTGITLPGTPDAPEPRAPAAVAEMLAQAGDLAGRTERSNRPVILIYLAGGLLMLALCMLAYFAYARFDAMSRLRAQTDKANRIEEVIARLKEFDRVNEERRAELTPQPTIQTQITDAAVAAGLKTKLSPAQPGQAKGPGDLMRRTYKYADLHEESLEHLFDWISRAQHAVPGLELTGLSLKPESQYWRAEVVFGRWERTGG